MFVFRSSTRFGTCGVAWSLAWRRAGGWGVAAAHLLTAQPGAAQVEPIGPGPSEAVELELVLAVDASSSVSPEQFNLQMGGFAGAFREPSVIAAIAATGGSGIDRTSTRLNFSH